MDKDPDVRVESLFVIGDQMPVKVQLIETCLHWKKSHHFTLNLHTYIYIYISFPLIPLLLL